MAGDRCEVGAEVVRALDDDDAPDRRRSRVLLRHVRTVSAAGQRVVIRGSSVRAELEKITGVEKVEVSTSDDTGLSGYHFGIDVSIDDRLAEGAA